MPRWTWGAALVPALALAGYVLWPGSSDPSPLPIPAEGPRDTLVVAVSADPQALLSPLASGGVEQSLGELIGLSLLEAAFDCTLSYSPRLARSWQWSDDGRTVRFELRDDLTWEDGDPVDTADVALTFALLADPAVQSPRSAALASLDPALRPWVIDATHVEFTFTELRDRAAMLASIATIPLVPAHALAGVPHEAAALADHPLNTTAPLSAGPWKLVQRIPGEKLVFEPNPNWNAAPSKLRRIIVRVIPEYADRIAALLAGGVDLVDGLHVGDADRLATDPTKSTLARRGRRTQDAIFWNNVQVPSLTPQPQRRSAGPAKPQPHPLFGDVAVRRALTMAIDVDRMVKDLLSSPTTGDVYAQRSLGTIAPASCTASTAPLTPLPHDIEAARLALADAGWSDNNGDGIAEKKNIPLRFTLLTYAGSARREQAATMLQADLLAAGVDMQVELLDSAVLNERLRTREFDAVLGGWTATPYPSATNWEAGDDLNFVSYANPNVSKWVTTADAAAGEAAVAAWQSLEAEIYADQPWTFLYWVDDLVAVDARFEGTRHDPMFAWRHPERWSVPAERVKYPL